MQQSLIGSLAALPDAERVAFLKSLSEAQAEELLWDWRAWARPNQLAPEGDWLTWVVLAGRGFGKMVADDTAIPTPSGWTTMGLLSIGDTVFDEGGKPCRVTAKFSPQVNEQYRVTFSDGSYIDACADHQWVTWTHAERKAFLRSPYEDTSKFPENWPQWRLKRRLGGTDLPESVIIVALDMARAGKSAHSITRDLGVCRHSIAKHIRADAFIVRSPVQHEDSPGPQIRTTKQILSRLRYGSRGDLNHCIPCTLALELPTIDLPIPPYTLGAWLGDGTSSDGTFTCHDDDAPHLRTMIEADGFETTYVSKRQTIGTRGFYAKLRMADVLGNKHVPTAYLRASKEQRLALLRGLMDTDGNIENQNTVAFVNTNRRLVDAVQELVHSLGMKTKVWSGIGSCNGKTGKRFWRVQFTPTINPFSLPRKANRIILGGQQSLRNHHRMIVAIEPINPVPMSCITVNSPNSMYLVGREMIPTHNTRCGAEWIREEVMSGRAKRIALVAETQKDLEEVLVFGDSGLASVFPPSERPTITKKPIRIEFKNGALALGYNATEPDQLRGPQFDCFVAGTMVATPQGEVPIEHLQIGDWVTTRLGPRRVVDARSRVQPIGRVTFNSGTELVGTREHPVLTSHGWTMMSDLQKGDRVCASNVLNGVENVGTGTVPGTMHTVGHGHSSAKIELRYIVQCMKRLSGLYHRAWTFITSTAMLQTTPQAICNYLLAANTWRCTELGNLFQKLTGLRNQFPLALASIVVNRSAERNAIPNHAFAKNASINEQTPSAQRRANVKTAEHNSRALPDSSAVNVVSTWQDAGQDTVYNLQVDGQPEYFANGILVHNCAWCDELAKWRYARETWDMLQFGMRLGSRPRQVITTTPRPIPLLREILADPTTVATRGSTYDNAMNLAPSFIKQVIRKYEGTRLGRQELDAEILEDVPGALWSRDAIDKLRKRAAPDMVRVVVAIDPSGTRGEEDEGDSIGIVVAGKGVDGRGYVLADRTCKLGPDGWGRRAISAYYEFRADRIVAERNFGGAMVEHVIRTIDNKASFKEVVASRGKIIRAEPVAALYEQGRVSHVGSLPDLEDQLCQFQSDGYLGEGSPDRVDSLVWAITELMIEPELLPPTFGTYGM